MECSARFGHVDGAIKDTRCQRFAKEHTKKFLLAAVGQGRINVYGLMDGIREEISA